MRYLGHIVSGKGIATDPDKTTQVKDWPTPTNRKELRRFLGFTGYYRRFIKGYSQIVSPLYRLTSGDPRRRKRGSKRNSPSTTPPFVWTDDCQKAMDLLKKYMTSPPILAYADYDLPFILQTDASGVGLGAVLSQIQNGTERVIAYISRGLNPAESRYPAHKREFLAMKWAITDKLRDYLLGNKFTVLTDNNPLLYVTTSAKLDATGQRWVAALSQFDFTVKYKPGKNNAAADALSRKPHSDFSRTSMSFQKDAITIPSHIIQAICSSQPPVSLPFMEPPTARCDVITQSHTPVTVNELPRVSHKDLISAQRTDPDISRAIYYLEKGRKPNPSERTHERPECLSYLRQWEKLQMRDGALYRVRKNV